MMSLEPLEQLYTTERGEPLPLPVELATLYGRLDIPSHPGRPYVLGNFVSTLDGVVALNISDRQSSGGEISGFNKHDRMLMGLLRAAADAVIVGAGTLRSVPRHRWTAPAIYPALTEAYQQLRSRLGKPEPPLNVIVSARGAIDLDLPVFQSGEVPVLLVTTRDGMQHLSEQSAPSGVQMTTAAEAGSINAKAVLEAVCRVRQSEIILVEGGPLLMNDFLAERRLDELFLTLAPQVAGRDDTTQRPGFVAGKLFAPDDPRWGTLVSVHRGGSHLFLRYAFETTAT